MSGAQVGQFGKAARITQPALAERQEALTLLSYENHVVPGLLQTEAYARAVFSCLYPPISPEEEEERVSARLDRKQVFERKPWPATSRSPQG